MLDYRHFIEDHDDQTPRILVDRLSSSLETVILRDLHSDEEDVRVIFRLHMGMSMDAATLLFKHLSELRADRFSNLREIESVGIVCSS